MTIGAIETTEMDPTEMIGKRKVIDVPLAAIDFEITDADLAAWDEVFDRLISEDNKEFGTLQAGDVVLEIGKYEPPHRGHAYQIYAGAKKANLYAQNPEDRATLVVIVGSPKEENPAYDSEDYQKYPFSFDERVKLLQYMAKKLKLSDEVIENNFRCIEVRDKHNNEQWVENVINEVEQVRGLGTIRTILANDVDAKLSTSTAFRENSDKRLLRVRPLEGQETGTQIRKRVFAQGGQHRVIGLPAR